MVTSSKQTRNVIQPDAKRCTHLWKYHENLKSSCLTDFSIALILSSSFSHFFQSGLLKYDIESSIKMTFFHRKYLSMYLQTNKCEHQFIFRFSLAAIAVVIRGPLVMLGYVKLIIIMKHWKALWVIGVSAELC